ncbi:DUF6046 domain-containing protein [Flammeovirga sp. SJP92]|uniref:DUF6046 domain-containing protein n=1 Tax=Flammeovirga sp. SJP92 TaxID=1775430 RepID=UPI0007871B1B|nr:DUF6046 domain-containing protein [Flammeovirga sp. SJP92]KXX70777.1 hypothetical protein AVL50_07155 [Flammeovirga sp. SJP92]
MKYNFNQHNAQSTATTQSIKQVAKKASQLQKIEVFTEELVDNLVFEASDGSERFEFVETPLIDPRRKKHFITTPINSGKHEVVELVNMKSWEIAFKGLFVDSEKHHYPQAMVRSLTAFFEKHKTVKAYHQRLSVLGISEIFLYDLSFTSVLGNNDSQQYALLARSIQSPEITLLEA